jgi:hypothetical protein
MQQLLNLGQLHDAEHSSFVVANNLNPKDRLGFSQVFHLEAFMEDVFGLSDPVLWCDGAVIRVDGYCHEVHSVVVDVGAQVSRDMLKVVVAEVAIDQSVPLVLHLF